MSADTLRAWLDAVAEITRAVNEARPLGELLGLIADAVCRLTGQDFCAVLLADPDRDQLVIEGSSGLSDRYVAAINAQRAIRLRPGPQGEGPSSRAFRSQRPVQVEDTARDSSFGPWEGAAFSEGYRSLLSVPLVTSGQAVGVLNSYRNEPHQFDAEDIVLLETLANQGAIAIEAATLREAQQRTIERLESATLSLKTQQGALERLDRTHRELMNVVLGDTELDTVTEALARTLGMAVTIEDDVGRPMAEAALGTQGAGAPPLDRRDNPDLQAVLVRLETERSVVEAHADGRRRLVAPVLVGGELVARVWACEIGDGGVVDARTFERVAAVVAFQLLKQRTADAVEARLSRDLLGDLLSLDEQTDTAALKARAANLGHDLSRPHVVLVVRPDSGSDTIDGVRGRSSPNPHSESFQRRVLSFVHAATASVAPRALVTARHGDVVVLWPAEASGTTAQRLARTLRQTAPMQLSGATVSIAIGGRCEQLTDYAPSLRSARGALYLAASGRDNQVIDVEDLGVYRFLLQVHEPGELRAFAHGLLDALHQDTVRGVDLFGTIRTYFDSGCVVAETARRLFVHPNTVTHRLRRAEELLGRDLRQPEDLLNVQFAMMILDVFEPGNSWSGEER